MPLAIHGVFTRADGSSVSFSVGEDENDPVFCITDLLPHLGAEQNDRKLSDGIKAEELNELVGKINEFAKCVNDNSLETNKAAMQSLKNALQEVEECAACHRHRPGYGLGRGGGCDA